MAISITINGEVTLDESSGLQVGVATSTEDNNDSDVLLTTLPTTFSNRLFLSSGSGGLGLSNVFATTDGVAKSADNYIALSGTGSVISLNFTTSAGAALPAYSVGVDPATGAASGLSALDGGAIKLFSDLSGRVALGVDTTGNIVFALFLDPTANLLTAKVWMVQFEALANTNPNNFDDPLSLTGLGVGAGVSTSFDFNSLPSGQNLFGTVGSTTSGLIVFGKTPVLNADGTFTNASNTINTSQGGGPTTIGVNNQMFDPTDGAYFTFIKNPVANFLAGAPGGLDQGEADDADNMQYTGGTLESDGGFVVISQTQGNALASMTIEAFNIAGAPQGQALVAARGTGHVNLAQIKVYNAAGTLVENSALPGAQDPNVTISFSGGIATVTGLAAGYKVEFLTGNAAVKFDQVLITGTGGKFDIGGFGVNEPTAVAVPLTGVRFEDDGPSVDITLNGTAALVLDETDNDSDDNNVGGILAQNSIQTGSYLTLNSANFGTDGQNGASPTVWSLSLTGANVNGVDSGLDDTLTNTNVMLFVVNSTTIVGKAGSAAGPTVMTITIDATTGEITVVQNRSVEHDDANDHDESTSPAMINSGLVGATRTVTDGDGDQASDGVDVSQVFKFEDDGPDVNIDLEPTAALVLDETDNDSDDNNVGGILAQNSLQTSGYLSLNSATFGVDGEAGTSPTVYSLSLTGANVNGVNSGLDDSLTGADVMLFVVNSTTVVGKAGGSGGPVVMTISVNATTGELSVVQERAVEHDDTGDHDESTSPAMMNSGLVGVTRTITDGDGDHDSDSVDVSQVIKLEDDGPDVDLNLNPLAELRLDETDNDADDNNVGGILAQNSLAASGYLDINNAFFGSDGQAGANPTVWSLGLTGANVNGVDSNLNDTLSGDDVLLFVVNSTTIVGKAGSSAGPTVMTVTINASTGELSVVQNRAVEHDDPLDHDEAGLSSAMMSAGLISATRTITDGDGDHDSDSVDVSQVIKLEDDGPFVDLIKNGSATVTVDESTLSASDSITVGDLFTTNTANFGSDGAGTDDSVYKLVVGNPNSGLFDTATGEQVILSANLAGTLITGTVNDGVTDQTVFTIEVDPDTGEVTLTQYRAMVHDDPDDPDESTSPLSMASGRVSLERTITDGDGDSDSDVEDISSVFKFEDAGPIQPGPGSDIDNLITDDSLIPDSAEESTDDIFPDAPNFGSDGPRAIDPVTFNLELRDPFPDDGDDPDSGLIDTATGDAIRFVTDGNDIVGYVDDDGDGEIEAGETLEAVRYSLVATDSDSYDVTFTQSRAVFHALAATEETIAPNTVFVERHAFDGDGDPAEVVDFDLAEITFLLDDEPTIGPIANSIVDFAAGSTSGFKTLNGDVNNDPNGTPYALTSFTQSLVINGITLKPVSSGDDRVGYWADTNGDTIFGNAGDTEFYRLTLNESGAGTYKFDVLVNPPPANLEFNFNGLPSGQNLFGMVGTTSAAIMVFGQFPVLKADGTFTNASNTINTSQGGGNTTIGVNNQMFDATEGAYFTFVKGANSNFLGSNLDSNEADDADNMLYSDPNSANDTLEGNSAFLKIAQIQGNSLATMNITAYNITGNPQGRDLINASGQNAVSVTQVKVYNAAGALIENSAVAGAQDPNVTITFNGGVATVSGLNAGYKVEWSTNGNHDQVKIVGVAGKFDIGGFGLNQAQPTPDQVLDFTAQVTDGDGDTDTASWKIGIDGTGSFDDGVVAGVSII